MIIIFSFFSGIVHPGVPHPCNKTARNNNIISTLTRDLSPDGARRVTAKLVNELRKDEVGKKGDQLDLPSGSQNLHITIGQPAEKPQLSADGLIRLKTSTNFSTNQCEAVTQWVRDELGRAYVEPGAREQLIHVKDRLADFFTVKVFVIGKDGEESTTTHHLLYCHEVVPLILSLCDIRDLDPENIVITIGLDDGQGSIKVFLNSFHIPGKNFHCGKVLFYIHF